MKKILSIVCACTMCMSMWANEPELSLPTPNEFGRGANVEHSYGQRCPLDSVIEFDGVGNRAHKMTYSHVDNMETVILYNYDTEAGVWKQSQKEEYLFDEQGNLISQTDLYWDASGEWRQQENISVTVNSYTYDEFGNIIVKENKFSRSVYTYDEQHNRLSELCYKKDDNTGEWICYAKNIQEYNEFGNVILVEQYVLRTIDGEQQFVGNVHEEIFYDEKQQEVANNYNYVWNTDTNDWEYKYQWTNEYKEKSWLYTGKVWDNDSKDWVNHGQQECYIDGMSCVQASYAWNKKKSKWDGEIKYIYNYNDNGSLAEVQYFEWKNGKWQLLNDTFIFYACCTNQYMPMGIESIITPTHGAIEKQIINGQLIISIDGIRYDARGAMIR